MRNRRKSIFYIDLGWQGGKFEISAIKPDKLHE